MMRRAWMMVRAIPLWLVTLLAVTGMVGWAGCYDTNLSRAKTLIFLGGLEMGILLAYHLQRRRYEKLLKDARRPRWDEGLTIVRPPKEDVSSADAAVLASELLRRRGVQRSPKPFLN